MNAKKLLDEIRQFFTKRHSQYSLLEPTQRYHGYALFRNVRSKGLAIVAHLPLDISPDDGQLVMLSRHIRIEMKVIKGQNLFWLVDTIIRGDAWQQVLEEKIKALEELLEHVQPCERCDRMRVPKVFRQECGTWFVSTMCPECNGFRNTPYREGIKTRLHKFLQVRADQQAERCQDAAELEGNEESRLTCDICDRELVQGECPDGCTLDDRYKQYARDSQKSGTWLRYQSV